MPNRDDSDRRKEADQAEKLWDRARSGAKGALDWSRKISQVGKLKLDATRLQRQRLSLYEELGRKTYELIKEGRFDPHEVDQIVGQIDEITQLLDGYQKALDEAAKKKTGL